ncbi:MAG: hypothetical protein P8L46_14475 [Acidimicrobiales bacterium]|nr:hypothetical protein [Acidimicrobiales bacterium]
MFGLQGRSISWLIICSVFSLGCGSAEPETHSGGLLPVSYAELDLSTPELAVNAFVDAFADGDFITVALIFHPATQQAMHQAMDDETFYDWVDGAGQGALVGRLTAELGGDHYIDALRMFDLAMQSGATAGGLRFDFTKGASEIVTTVEDSRAALLDVTMRATGLSATFEMARSQAGDWRVRQIRYANGGMNEFPFSGDPPLPNGPTELASFDKWYQLLPADTPAATVETIGRLVARGDHLSIYFLLAAVSQRQSLLPLKAFDHFGGVEHNFGPAALDERLDATGFPYDIDKIVEIQSGEPLTAAGATTATVIITTETMELEARLLRDTTNRWRLRQLFPVGASDAVVPFPIS